MGVQACALPICGAAATGELERQGDRGDVGLEGVLVEGRHHGRVVGHDRGVALGRRGAGHRAALGLDAVFLEQEGRGVGLAEGHGAGNAEREGGNLYEAGMGVHCWVSLRRQVSRVRRAAWAMFPALAIPAGSPLPTDDADALYRGVWYRAQAGARLPPGEAGQGSWLQAAAMEPRMFVSIPSRQRHKLRWATQNPVAGLWLAFLWARTRPCGPQRGPLLE